MANCNYGDSEWDLLSKILNAQNATLAAISGNDLATENANITGINGVTPSVGCGVATAGTLRVAQATDCVVNALITNGAGAAAVNIQDGGNSITVDGAVTITPSGTQNIQGNVAHDAAATNNPVLIGAEGRNTLGTPVTSGDLTRIMANRYGMLNVSAFPPSHASSNGTPIVVTTTSVVAAPAAGNHTRVVRIHLSNGGATAAWVSVRDGAAGTQYYRSWLPQGATVSINLNSSGPLDLTTATRLDIVLSAAAEIEYTIDYYTVVD